MGLIAAGTQSEAGCHFVSKETLESGNLLTTPPMVEYNEEYLNPQNSKEIGVRITGHGLAHMNAQSTTTEQPIDGQMFSQAGVAANKAQITIDDNVAMPSARSRGGAASKYPFDQLNPQQSFFVAGEDVAKAMPSVVAAQNNRYATKAKNDDGSVQMREGIKREKQADGTTKTWKEQVPVKEYSKFFFSRSVTENEVKGVRVWRQS